MSWHRYSRLRHWSGRSNKAWGRLAAVLPSSRAHCTCCGVCLMCRPSGWIGLGRAVTADWRILGLWVWLVACSNPFVVWHSMCGPLGYAATCARRGPSILIAQAGPQARESRSKIISDLAQANTYQAFALLVLALDATAPQQRPRALFWDQRPQIACCGPSAHKSPRCASGLLRVLLDPTSYDGSRIMLPSPMPAAAATGQPRAAVRVDSDNAYLCGP